MLMVLQQSFQLQKVSFLQIKDLTIVHFAEGKGFDIDTSVSIGMKEGTRDSEFFKQVQSSLDKIDTETRNKWMKEANEGQPSSK